MQMTALSIKIISTHVPAELKMNSPFEMLEASGIISKLYLPNAFKLHDGRMFSLYGGLPQLSQGDSVTFKYKIKLAGDKSYNNIIEGSLEVLHITHSQEKNLSPPSLDKDTLIVRQSCLKAAVECVINLIIAAKPSEEVSYKKLIMELAEEFEKWVFREDGK